MFLSTNSIYSEFSAETAETCFVYMILSCQIWKPVHTSDNHYHDIKILWNKFGHCHWSCWLLIGQAGKLHTQEMWQEFYFLFSVLILKIFDIKLVKGTLLIVKVTPHNTNNSYLVPAAVVTIIGTRTSLTRPAHNRSYH